MNTGRLAGKRALITGAAAGLGAQMARRFHQEGAEILVNDLRLEDAEAVAKEVGGTSFARIHELLHALDDEPAPEPEKPAEPDKGDRKPKRMGPF